MTSLEAGSAASELFRYEHQRASLRAPSAHPGRSLVSAPLATHKAARMTRSNVDHHYLPQFHLRKWEGDNGKLSQWGRVSFNNKLVRRYVTTAQTAYVPGLYALEHVLPHEAQQVEVRIFGRIETETAPILDKLIARGVKSLTLVERQWWALYMNASILRVPHVIAHVKADAEQVLKAALSEDIPEYNELRGTAPEATLWDWTMNHANARLANAGMKVLIDVLCSQRTIGRMLQLTWTVRDVSRSPFKLMIGDDPLERIGDLYKPGTLISLPLSPTHLFFATDNQRTVSHVAGIPDRIVVRANNVSTLTTAKRFAYGEAEFSFIEKHLLTASQQPDVHIGTPF